MKFKTLEEVESYLEQIPRFQDSGKRAARFDLDAFQNFCNALGAPQRHFRSIHVAGTNGKGSTCQIFASVYQHAGYRSGVYTSPHLIDYSERFRINGKRISEEELVDFFQLHGEVVEQFAPTYFELSTAIAFWWFYRREVDIALIETGLGGRLDATNIIEPELSVITTVSLDHTDILGNDIRSIAREKAGIIKKGIPVVAGNLSSEALEIISAVAKNSGSPLHTIEEISRTWHDGKCILKEQGVITELQTDLVHPVQAHNVALVWKAVGILQHRFPVSEDALREGFAGVRKIYQNSGRFEKLHSELEWYFDGAHNPEAVKSMYEMVSSLESPRPPVLVLAIMRDKLNPQVVETFQKFKKIYYYKQESDRAADLEEIKKRIPGAIPFPEGEPEKQHLLKELETELVIFAGSFYFYSTVRQWLKSSTSVR